ncbi:MAG: L,D-transpeptidase [Myxococcota bacterium]
MSPRSSVAALTLLALAGCTSASAQDGADASLAFERVGTFELVATGALLGDAEAAGETGDELDEFVPEPPMPVAVEAAQIVAEPEPLTIQPAPEPIARRIARQQLTIYAQPTTGAPIRGRVPMAAAFDVFGYVEGPGCEGELGWANLGHHGFACMDNTRAGGDAQPRTLPKMRAGLTPYYYAKVKKGRTAPRYKSVKSMHAGDAPTATLKPGVDYAFTIRRVIKGEVVLIDAQRRVVREKDVVRFRPSRFAGRDLESTPIPAGKQLAWVSNWPEASSFARASSESELSAMLGYHDELLVEPADTDGWYKLENGSFVSASDLRVFAAPTERPDGVGEGDIWIDVDLDPQVLTVMLGDAPIYATLVSSGFKSPTPRGLFRIHNKLAVGSMSSSPGADDFYDVQAVPHVQYFLGSFALHSAYWHDYFGRPLSHGCVNLSPKDAQHVFSLTTPTLPGGWIHGYESSEHLGTTVHIHKGAEQVRDRRDDVEPVYGR